MSADAATVRAVIVRFLERSDKPTEALTSETGLWGDGLGLDSLEAAELSAMLEDEFGTDPFSSGDLPETVGDVLSYYEASAHA
ncbi:MAG: acyl carrier protein [Marmoricola sp.]